MNAIKKDDLREATRLADAGELDDAWLITEKRLVSDPNDSLALLIASHIFEKAKKTPVAYSMAKRVTELSPEKAAGWINLGRCADNLWRLDEAVSCYSKALERAENQTQRLLILTNLAAVHIQRGNYHDGEAIARRALLINPEDGKSRHNLGICLLARRQWRDGWQHYSASIGTSQRRLVKYNDEPVWNGEKGKTVVVYGEQGLGDEISFASLIPDVIRDSKKVIIDCDARLKNLFQRSFPEAKVYGTRTANELDWEEVDRRIDYSISCGEVAKFYRNKDADFPGSAYLVPCPDRLAMWKSLFSAKRKPAIGLAWSGGAWGTGSMHRAINTEELRPLMDVDAHFVNLQYKEENANGLPIAYYPYATMTKDYDDTAALVASLDLVICMQTSVAHLAGALGIPCWVMVPSITQWRYGNNYDSIPWAKSIKIYRQGNGWTETIKQIRGDLVKWMQ